MKAHPTIDSEYILTLHRISFRYSEKNINKSFEYYEKVSNLSDSLNYTYGKALSQINLGLLLFTSANYDASNSAYFRAIDYAEASNAKRLKAVSLNNIGENFRALNDYKKCRQYTEQAVEINKQLLAWRGVATNYELLQRCDLKEHLYEDAKKNLMEGMPYALKSNDSYTLSLYYVGFGKYSAVHNQKDSAIYNFTKALELANQQGDLRNKYQIYIAKAEFLKEISPDDKLKLLQSAYNLAKQTGYIEGIGYSAELLSSFYDQKRKKDSAAQYFHIYRSAYDSIFSENNRRNVVNKETDWMIKRKEIENKHLKELSQIQKRDIVFKNALLLVIIILLLLVIVTAFFIYNNFQSKKKRGEAALKQKITETKMELLRSQMNPHFIFNSLNSIENFMMRYERRTASEYLTKFSELIRIMLDSSRTDLVPFFKSLEAIQLYVELERLRFNNKFTFELTIDLALSDGDYMVPPLLIQAYVENAILHGLSQSEADGLKLSITATLQNEYIIYIIEDNGIGREQSAKYKQHNKPFHKSLGSELTQERIDIFNLQHNAESGVVITDLYNKNNEPCGTRVQVKIKAL
ncbi:MAG TPA: histidine kinase [Hanamia sp.]|nr:histidine kinase [Hanamia sp.]